MALDREARVATNKLSAILRLANALDADHLQKVKDLHIVPEDENWVLEVEGAGDLTMERLAALARADYLTEVFGRQARLPRGEAASVAMTKAEAKSRKKEPELFLNRELYWLEFNGRVLEEAMDPTTPLLERLKFAIIVSSNLDEFFMVRVAALKHAIDEGDANPDAAGLRPRQQLLAGLRARARDGGAAGQDAHGGDPAALAERGIRFMAHKDLEEAQRAFLGRYFTAEVLPALTPLAIDVSRPFPQLANLSLNLALLLAPPEGEDAAAAGRGAGPGRAAPARAPPGRRRQHATCCWRRSSAPSWPRSSPGRRSWRSPPSGSRATRRWSSTRRAGATTSRPSRTSCASGA